MTGLALAGGFYRDAVAPLIDGVPHAAALLGDGSEVLGLDDDVSPDHDFGPRVQVFVPDGEVAHVRNRLDALPDTYGGHPVRYAGTTGGDAAHHVEVTSAGRFFRDRLGADPADGMTLADWLLAPTQRLATLTAGAVFHDPAGDLAARRDAIRWYPPDVWRYALASAWLRVEQEEPFVGRTGGSGDDLGSRVLAARLVRDLMRIAFLVERRWAPYGKWFGHAFGALRVASSVRPDLDAALAAAGWREREAALVSAASRLVAATNDLGLAAAVDPAPGRFHDRDIRVVGAGRVTLALAAAIRDADVRALRARLGLRHATDLGRFPGTIDQAVDSTDVLADPARCRAAGALLGLAG